MLAWLLWQLERIERIHAVARALMNRYGDDAYTEARRRERQGRGDGTAGDWRRVALVVARWTPNADAGLVARAPSPKPDPVEAPAGIVSDEQPTFRIQFVCGTTDCRPTNLMEKQVQVADAPAAIIAAANIKWPPQTIGVRILDREGHEVFARRKAQPG
jgi:hypothetical protein